MNATEVRVRSAVRVTPTLLDLRLTRPPNFTFRAGQFAALWLPDRPRAKRMYSIASSPAEDDALRFLIEIFPGGVVSPRLAACAPGETVGITERGMGRFFYPPDEGGGGRVFLAGWGSGIAPLLSIAAAARSDGRDVVLRYVVPNEAEASEVVAPTEVTRVVSGPRGAFPNDLAEEARADDLVYLAGPHAFTHGLAARLPAPPERIRIEQWG